MRHTGEFTTPAWVLDLRFLSELAARKPEPQIHRTRAATVYARSRTSLASMIFAIR
jgi:hypothetical protein